MSDHHIKAGTISASKKTPEERLALAKKANNERWNPSIPKATHSGILIIADQEIACDVLEDGRRVIRTNAFLKAMGRGKVGGSDRKGANHRDLPIFLCANNLTQYLEPEILKRGSSITYRGQDGRKVTGYDATFLPEVCKIYMKGRNDNVLHPQQMKIAIVCEAILCGLATVGITAMIDDATGYVKVRDKDEFQRILANYISEELRKWTKRFPDEFFRQVYKIHGWNPGIGRNRPQCIGGFINKYIYDRLPPGILEELKKKNPKNEKGHRSYTHHQFLTEDIGDDNLQKQISQVITLMKVSDNLDDFKKMISKV